MYTILKTLPQFKTVYVYDPSTGEFQHPAQSQLDPVENTDDYLATNQPKYITPIYHTDAAPPAASAAQVAVFVSSSTTDPTAGSWLLKEDHRGSVIYNQTDGTTQTVVAIGPVPQGYALTPPPPTTAQQVAALEAAVQVYIDSKALAKGYDSANSCISYLNSSNATWKADATAMNTWRDAVWTFCYNSKSAVSVGSIPMPTSAQLIAALPAAPW
jgi:hypothetical protein